MKPLEVLEQIFKKQFRLSFDYQIVSSSELESFFKKSNFDVYYSSEEMRKYSSFDIYSHKSTTHFGLKDKALDELYVSFKNSKNLKEQNEFLEQYRERFKKIKIKQSLFQIKYPSFFAKRTS